MPTQGGIQKPDGHAAHDFMKPQSRTHEPGGMSDRAERRHPALATGASFFISQLLWFMLTAFVVNQFTPASGTRFGMVVSMAALMLIPTAACVAGVLVAMMLFPPPTLRHQGRIAWIGVATGLLSSIVWLACWWLLEIAQTPRVARAVEAAFFCVLLAPITAFSMLVIVKLMVRRRALILQKDGCCPTCGYELCGLRPSGALLTCPECGDQMPCE